jgi:hypothetical protein
MKPPVSIRCREDAHRLRRLVRERGDDLVLRRGRGGLHGTVRAVLARPPSLSLDCWRRA